MALTTALRMVAQPPQLTPMYKPTRHRRSQTCDAKKFFTFSTILQIDSDSNARGFVLHQTAQEIKLKECLRKELQTNAKSPTWRPTAASRNAWKRAALQVTRGFHVGCRGSWGCGIPKAQRQVAMHSTLRVPTAPMALCRPTGQHLVRPACHTAPRRNSLSEPSLRVKPASATGLFEARCLFPPPRARQTQGEARRCRSWRAALST